MGDDTTSGAAGGGGSAGNGGGDAPAALQVIRAFGGIRPMAHKLNVPVSTVQGWKERGVIPEARQDEIRAAAEAHGVTLDEAALSASAEAPPEDASEVEVQVEAAQPAENEPAEKATAPRSTDDEGDTKDEPETPEATPRIPPSMQPPLTSLGSDPHASEPHGGGQGGRHGWLSGFIVGALVFVIGAGGAVLTKDYWAPQEQSAAANGDGGAAGDEMAQKLAGLDARLKDMETKTAAAATSVEDVAHKADITRLEGEIKKLTGTSAAGQDLAAQLDALDKKIAALDPEVAAGAKAASEVSGLSGQVSGLGGELAKVQSELAALKTSLDELKTQTAALSEDRATVQKAARQEAALWAAVGRLRDAVRYAGSFSGQLADVNRLAGDKADLKQALAPLEPYAAEGVPTLTELQRSFPATAREVVAAGYQDTEEGMLGGVLRRFSEVVTVRPSCAEATGEGTPDIVTRAECRLDDGDLDGALTQLAALSGAAKEAAAGWVAKADRRKEADAAISALNGLLAGQAGTGG